MTNNLKNSGLATQFGQPNGNDNTKGGTKKGKTTTTIIKELLKSKVNLFSNNEDYKGLDVNTALAVELISMAFHKSNKPAEKLNAIKEILDRIEGKPKQSIGFEINEIKPIETIRLAPRKE